MKYTCDVCKSEFDFNVGIGVVNLQCLKAGCRGRTIIFDTPIRRRPISSQFWEIVNPGISVAGGHYPDGFFEVELLEGKEEVKMEEPESIKQFEDKTAVEEKPAKAPRIKIRGSKKG